MFWVLKFPCFQVRRPGDGSFLTLQDFDAKAHKALVVLVCNSGLGLQDASVGEKLGGLELCQHQAFLRNDFRMLDVGGLVRSAFCFKVACVCVNAPSHPEEPPKMRGYFGLQTRSMHST